MDPNSLFQNPFDLDLFSSFRLPSNLAVSDPLDILSRRKDSLMSFGSPSRFKPQVQSDFFHPAQFDPTPLFHASRPEDIHFDQTSIQKADALGRDWQNTSLLGQSDLTLDPNFNRDFTVNPYQIGRSRAGSFNYGRFRRDSEDLFHSNPDFFKQLYNVTDTRNALESAFQNMASLHKFPQHLTADSMNNLTYNESLNNLSHNLTVADHKFDSLAAGYATTALTANPTNTSSTEDTVLDRGESEDEDLEKIEKKTFLNDRSQAKVGQDSTKKVGRPKKLVVKKVKTAKNTSYVPEDQSKKSGNKPILAKLENCQSNSAESKKNNVDDISQLKIPGNLKQIIEGPNIPKGVQDFFRNSYSSLYDTKKIGTLTPAERRAKVLKYLEKRKKRSYSRRVNYDCRKRVADNRLRIKGRFVTREQAFVLLEEAGIQYNPDTITNPEIKAILTEKLGGNVTRKRKGDDKVEDSIGDANDRDDVDEEYY